MKIYPKHTKISFESGIEIPEFLLNSSLKLGIPKKKKEEKIIIINYHKPKKTENQNELF